MLEILILTRQISRAALCPISPTPVSGRAGKPKMRIVPTNCSWVAMKGRNPEMCFCIMMWCVKATVFAFQDLGVEFRVCHELEDEGCEGVSIECQAIVCVNRIAGVVIQVRMFACSCLPPQRRLHRRKPQGTTALRESLGSTSAEEVAYKSTTGSCLFTVTLY